MNKIILVQLFDAALEINGFSNKQIIGNQNTIKEVLETFNNLLKAINVEV